MHKVSERVRIFHTLSRISLPHIDTLAIYLAEIFSAASHKRRAFASCVQAMSDLQALPWSAPKRDCNELCSSCGLARACSRARGEDCKKARAIFALSLATSGSDPLGRKRVALGLSGKGPRKEKWRNVVLRNLGIKESSVKNLAEVPVAPHHWAAGARERAKKIGGKGPATTYLQRKKSADVATSPPAGQMARAQRREAFSSRLSADSRKRPQKQQKTERES